MNSRVKTSLQFGPRRLARETVARGCFFGLVIALAGSPAFSAVLVYEGFSGYTANSQLEATGFGTGWSANWADSGGTGATYQNTDFFSGSGLPAGGTPARIGGSGNKAANNSAYNKRSTASLSGYFDDGDTVWFSYMIALRNPFNAQFNIGFGNTDNTGTGSGIGISVVATGASGVPATTGQLYARVGSTLSPSSVPVQLGTNAFGAAVATNLSYFIVGRFTAGVGAGNDQLDVWVNPGTSPLGTPSLTLSGVTLASTPNQFSFYTPPNSAPSGSGLLASTQTALWFDEIKLATTVQDLGLTMQVPEPASVGLLLMGMMLLFRRSRTWVNGLLGSTT